MYRRRTPPASKYLSCDKHGAGASASRRSAKAAWRIMFFQCSARSLTRHSASMADLINWPCGGRIRLMLRIRLLHITATATIISLPAQAQAPAGWTDFTKLFQSYVDSDKIVG